MAVTYRVPEPDFEEAQVSIAVPHSREAEEAVISSVFISPETYFDLAVSLKSEHFYIVRNRWIYESFERVAEAGKRIDIITVGDDLEKQGKLEEIGGPAYLTALINCFPIGGSAEDYAAIIVDRWIRRQAIHTANETAQAAYDLRKEFESEKFSLALTNLTIGTEKKQNVMENLYRDLFESNSFSYGVSDLDNRLGGKFRGELEIIAGDQGTGKTARMFDEAVKNADLDHRILICSLEMKEHHLWARKACGQMGVSWNQVRSKKVSEEIRRQIYELVDTYRAIYKDKIIFYEAPMNISNIVSAATRERPDMIYIDHVFLIEGLSHSGGAIQQMGELSNVTRILKQRVAKKLDCNVTLLWQLGKSFVNEKRRPNKNDLYLSDSRNPDSILIFYRPDQYQPEGITPKIVDVDVIVAKARNDYSGNGITMKYNLEKQTFHGMAREEWHE